MSTQEWTVKVDGRSHHVTVDYDWQVGRATIRVDGRVAAKPMTNDESERDVPIGTARYIVRRMPNDTFDLDVQPETFIARRTMAGKQAIEIEKPGFGKKLLTFIGAAVVLLLVLGFIRVGRRGFQYMRVPWQPYTAEDRSFTAKFPEAPRVDTESRNINGDIWDVVSLLSQYKGHYYAVQYVDLHMVVLESNQRTLMNRFFDGWMKVFRASVLQRDEGTLARNPTIEFVATIPAGVGEGSAKLPVPATLRGIVAMRDKRLFFVWTLAAAADPITTDLRDFMKGFEPAPPPERPHSLQL